MPKSNLIKIKDTVYIEVDKIRRLIRKSKDLQEFKESFDKITKEPKIRAKEMNELDAALKVVMDYDPSKEEK